ncbi:MAG: DedA family protein [Psychrilyobacter sp.]|uniref:DedA family protein n=1 Tax=Psychrilyobacter sp. TaxID=2586924 RepID=UPI003C789604
MSETINYLVKTIENLGYIGIVLLMILESSFFPFPSEIIMIPAGYLASIGEMNFILIIIFGILGSLIGSWFNYFLACRYGRVLLLKIIKEEKIKKLEIFFENHGHISTFTGRLIPGVRQYISFPAGLARMNPLKFSIYTGLGAGIWCTVLTLLGYVLGKNQEMLHKYLREITIITLILVTILIIGYVYNKRRKKT